MNPVQLFSWWKKASKLPGGKWFFSQALGKQIPYTGSVPFRIEKWEPGSSTVELLDQRKARNHLVSLHALALANVGELSTGLALHSLLGEKNRAILLKLEIKYLKKARGTIRAEGACPALPEYSTFDQEVESKLFDKAGELVAEVKTTWKVDRKA